MPSCPENLAARPIVDPLAIPLSRMWDICRAGKGHQSPTSPAHTLSTGPPLPVVVLAPGSDAEWGLHLLLVRGWEAVDSVTTTGVISLTEPRLEGCHGPSRPLPHIRASVFQLDLTAQTGLPTRHHLDWPP